jgi:hypothetical protein
MNQKQGKDKDLSFKHSNTVIKKLNTGDPELAQTFTSTINSDSKFIAGA